MDKTKALNLNYLPRTSAVHFGFRQPLNSSQLNELHQNILEDLLELFNQSMLEQYIIKVMVLL